MANKKAKGPRAKSRHKITAKRRPTVRELLEKPPLGAYVQININGSWHEGMPHRRFQGKTGIVKAYRGSCVEVLVKDGDKEKLVVAHPVHLNIIKVSSEVAK